MQRFKEASDMYSDDLIELIARHKSPNVFNPWRDNDPLDAGNDFSGASCRAQRLWRHFNCIPHYLLIGEAPGYQGCHFSGVPFTNEKLILDGKVPRVEWSARITRRDKPWSEPSATIVWGMLREIGIANDVVMWNAFAWHPHKPGEPMSNRAPTKPELASGANVLRAVVEYFKGALVIAVGQVAYKALQSLNVSVHARVRHPSMGGAREFRDGLAQLVRI
jgi:uracil-DNA glycosylase